MASNEASADGLLIEAVGGVRVGSWNASWPFASIKVFPDRVTLKMPVWGETTLPKTEITSVRKVGWLPIPIAQGLRFHHRISGMPAKVVFLTGSRNAIYDSLQAAGYPTA